MLGIWGDEDRAFEVEARNMGIKITSASGSGDGCGCWSILLLLVIIGIIEAFYR